VPFLFDQPVTVITDRRGTAAVYTVDPAMVVIPAVTGTNLGAGLCPASLARPRLYTGTDLAPAVA
jgi:hypothetical protein